MIILLCAFLTVLIEMPWMYIWGKRKRDEILLVVCVNLVTNILLNLGISFFFYGREVGGLIYLFEAFVVAMEFAVYALAFRPSWKLFLITLGANCISYMVGLLVF